MRDLGKAPARANDRMTLKVDITGSPVMIDRIETLAFPHSFIAKTQLERSIGILARQLREQGEDAKAVERVFMKLVSDEKMDLAFLCDFLDTASLFAERLRSPVAWIERIADSVATLQLPIMRRSLRAFQLFEEARACQGTERERIFIKSLELGL